MSTMSYLSAIEHYHEYRSALQELLGSIVTGIADIRLLNDETEQIKAMESITEHYPFFELLYILDENGRQVSDNVTRNETSQSKQGKGTDRSRRPYFVAAKESDQVIVTDPYFSSITGELCITTTQKIVMDDGSIRYVVLDIDLIRTIEFLMGDSTRRKFQPTFRAMYIVITSGLLCVVVTLLVLAFNDVAHLLWGVATSHEIMLKPFSIVIYLTLALAIFDLAKTILEEEVLMHKDIFRHSSTRRTITRFMAAILIAVSIEALLLMFKSALGDGDYLIEAVWMMMTAVGLLVGLGAYVYLGAKAETLLKQMRTIKRY